MKHIKVFWIVWAVVMTIILVMIAIHLLDDDNKAVEFRRGYSAGYEQGQADSDSTWRQNLMHRIDSLLEPGIDTFKFLETDTTTTSITDTLRGS